MQIRESELFLLNFIHKKRALTGPAMAGETATRFSKPYLYSLLNDLEASQLLSATLVEAGRRGPPAREYKVTPLGERVRVAANELSRELSKAGRVGSNELQPV
jgi:DNA-binding PadR family transcriptional regulator